METIGEFIQKGIEKAGGTNKLAVQLRTNGSFISQAHRGVCGLGEEHTVRLAEYLGEDPERLLLLLRVERCPEKTRPFWIELYRKLSNVAAVLLFIIMAIALPSSSDASAFAVPKEGGAMYIMSNLFRRLRARLLTTFAPLESASPLPSVS